MPKPGSIDQCCCYDRLGACRAGRFGYVSAQGDNKVVKFSLREWKPVLEIETGTRPDPLAILPGR